jgi:hypothetical protein
MTQQSQQTKFPVLVSQKPSGTLRTALHSPKVTVWCTIFEFGMWDPYFFEEDDVTVTVTSDRYCAMLENFLQPKLDDLFDERAAENGWFQKDSATVHTSRRSLGIVLGMLSPCLVTSGGRRGCQICPRAIFSPGAISNLRRTNIVPKLWNILRRQ